MFSFKNRLYYFLKPFIPRYLQLIIRRKIVLQNRLKYKNVWPIDEKALKPPDGWSGWPDGKRFALILTHDVETAKGQEKCKILSSLEESLGFRSSYNLTAKQYNVSSELRHYLVKKGFEVGVHGLYHDRNLFSSKKIFREQAFQINQYLEEWASVGFRTPCMYHNLEWISDLNIEYDSSTFDTDPFEPQPDGMGTIFPFLVHGHNGRRRYIELPYTLPQDFTLFVLMKEQNIDIWKNKLDWIVENRGMALSITHPDYMNYEKGKCGIEEYPMEFYEGLLDYIKEKYKGQYWNPLPKEMARFWKENMGDKGNSKFGNHSMLV
jgi:hypothetical protein